MRETEVFSDREMKMFFDLVLEQAPPLHKATILLLFTTGMRQAEVRNLKLSNFKNVEGIRMLTYVGKCQKFNKIPVHPATAHYLDEYQAWMESVDRKIQDGDCFF